MTVLNQTIDNVNPFILYTPAGQWIEGARSAPLDPYCDSYFAGTFTVCTTNGATASFVFNGTAVWIFGAKRNNHGPYIVSLDGSLSTFDGYANNPGIFQTPLFTATDLTNGLHIVQLINAHTDSNYPWLDLDFIAWETQMASSMRNGADSTDQDSDPAFKYQPSESWSSNHFNGTSGQVTTSDGAYVEYTFTVRDAVEVYGTVGPANAPYSVQLDNGQESTFNATKQYFASSVMLYSGSNLGDGQHVLKMTNRPAQIEQTLAIEYAVIVSDSSQSSVNSGGSTNGTPSDPSNRKSSTVGVIVGVIAVGAVISTLIFFLMRRRRRKHKLGSGRVQFRVLHSY